MDVNVISIDGSSVSSSSVSGSSVNGSAGCRRCESLPPKISGPGTLHMQFPLAHSYNKILTYLRSSGLEYSQQGERVSVNVGSVDLAPVVAPLMDVLSSTEQADVRVLFQARGREMDVNSYFEVESLHGFITKAQSGWLLDMMAENRLTTWFQPIVKCQESGQVYAYECLLRGQDNQGTVFPGRILDVARGAGLLFQLDRAARLTNITNAHRQGIKSHIFINFTPTSIYDPVNCLRSTVKAVDEMGLQRSQVIFEVIESELVRDVPHLKEILDYYRASGFRVALDDVGSGYSSLNMLGQLRPDYIKLDRELISGVQHDSYKAVIAQKLLETAQELKIQTITEGIEEEGEFHWARDHGADYAQGYYFARPAAIPPMLENQLAAAQ
ncbi:MAG TPA: EAL domain-containing protein [Abditibacteriaceae bacterium]|jgi:EAL domain-containing protein (putative c-di-GMP-specific phosphodiesterase class I)